MTIRTRFAPSPTGELHIGGLRTALFTYLVARQAGGTFILRVEDTDRNRFDPHSADHIQEALRWAGLEWDEGPYFQSQRLDHYHAAARELVARGAAYPCFCSPERLEVMRKEQERQKQPPRYDRRCRTMDPAERDRLLAEGSPHTIRQAIPETGITTFHDTVYGTIAVRNEELDDAVLLKSDGFPTYHLAHLVDDHLMNISHVIRGEEGLPSAPTHVLLDQAFGWEMPQLCHLPSILAGGGQGKLSKRHGAVSVISYMREGYLPEALLNFLALLGWSPGDDREFFSKEELVRAFSLEKVSHTGAVFNREKLDYFNGYYIRHWPPQELARMILPYLVSRGLVPEGTSPAEPYLLGALATVQDRLRKLSEAPELLSFYYCEPEYERTLLVPRKANLTEVYQALAGALEVLRSQDDFSPPVLEANLRGYAEAAGLKSGLVLWPVRAALTGREASPGAFEVLSVLGRERSLQRIERALNKLGDATP
jgi:glutamyl-tRNA synthetase